MSKRIWAGLLTGVAICVSPLVWCDDLQPSPPLGEGTVRQMLVDQGLPKAVVNEVVKNMIAGSEESTKNGLQLSGALYTSGVNGALVEDNDWWDFDGILNYNGRAMRIPQLFSINYFNGGLNIEASYKFVWIFLPPNVSLQSLDGAEFGGKVFGRGISVGTSVIVGNPVFIQGGWVSRINGVGNAYILAVGLDVLPLFARSVLKKEGTLNKFNPILTGTITFPKLVIQQKRVLPGQ